MATCYNCGRHIEEGTGVRKEVYTGHSKTAGIFGRRLWYGGRENYGMKLICEDCAKPTLFDVIAALIKLAVFIVVVSFIYNVCTPGCGGTHTKSNLPPQTTSDLQNVILAKEDSVEIRNKLSEITKMVESIHVNSEKAKNQCERFMRLYTDNRISEYEVYKTVEMAKETFNDKSNEVHEISAPAKLPENLKDTFNIAMAEFSTYYGSMTDAYGIIMNTMDNGGKFSDVKKYREQVALANQYYKNGLINFLLVKYRMGLLAKSKSKKTKHKKVI